MLTGRAHQVTRIKTVESDRSRIHAASLPACSRQHVPSSSISPKIDGTPHNIFNPGNPYVGGTSVALSGSSHSVTIDINVWAYVPGYPKLFFYVLKLSLGTNEFGVHRGYKIIDLPALEYDSANDCLKGGNPPVVSGLPLCTNAYTPGPSKIV